MIYKHPPLGKYINLNNQNKLHHLLRNKDKYLTSWKGDLLQIETSSYVSFFEVESENNLGKKHK